MHNKMACNRSLPRQSPAILAEAYFSGAAMRSLGHAYQNGLQQVSPQEVSSNTCRNIFFRCGSEVIRACVTKWLATGLHRIYQITCACHVEFMLSVIAVSGMCCISFSLQCVASQAQEMKCQRPNATATGVAYVHKIV